MRGFVLNQYEPNPSKFDRFRQTFSFPSKTSKKSGPKMNQFSTFSQRPSPQAPAPRPQKMLQITLVSPAKVSSRLDQMAPHSCPFFVSKINSFSTTPPKTRLGTLGFTARRKGNLPFFIFYLFLPNDSTIAHFPFLRPVI